LRTPLVVRNALHGLDNNVINRDAAYMHT